jgi:hypothetical protein
MRRFGIGIALMTAACATVPPGEEAPEEIGGSGDCSAEGLENLIGQPATSELGAEAMRRSGARALRWIRPGDAVTMDFREDRLNVNLDAENRVERFNCG